jgi:dTDP-4-dehydrorhamnose 3,5-epimerase-like enzyme
MAASLISIDSFTDARGNLLVGEFPKNLPFAPTRFFVVSGVPNGESRGHHAHKTNQQILICLEGKVNVRVNDGTRWAEFVLDSGSKCLHLPALHWGEQHYASDKTKLLVLASESYSAEEYINSFEEFLEYSS